MKAQCVRDRKKNSIFIHNMKKEKPGPGGGFDGVLQLNDLWGVGPARTCVKSTTQVPVST